MTGDVADGRSGNLMDGGAGIFGTGIRASDVAAGGGKAIETLGGDGADSGGGVTIGSDGRKVGSGGGMNSGTF